MQAWGTTTLKSLFLPGALLLLGCSVLVYSGWLTLALPAISFLYYCALVGGMLLAWRFHSSRSFLSLLVLFLATQAVSFMAEKQLVLLLPAIAVLVPANFVLIALMHERGFSREAITPPTVFLFAQSVVIVVLCNTVSPAPIRHHPPSSVSFPQYALVTVAAAGICLLIRFLLTRKPVDIALLWSLAAFCLSLHYSGTPRISLLYAAVAASIMGTSIIESSYLLAYHDELTMLPSRRAFNEALLMLQAPYSIAVVDIDHFKKFNDTYGHDTGDQVLRLVAANLARVTGGGQAYRCGGEEFTILFPGKTTDAVAQHLEQLRRAIETSEFRLRGDDRRQLPRGAERRQERPRGRAKKGHVIRQLAQERSAATLSVTVSIGVATAAQDHSDPELVLQVADKALYRAKANGRNRVETAATTRRARVKAAGIA